MLGEGARVWSEQSPDFWRSCQDAEGRLGRESLPQESRGERRVPCGGLSHELKPGTWSLASAPGRSLMTLTRAVGTVEQAPERKGLEGLATVPEKGWGQKSAVSVQGSGTVPLSRA